MFASAVALPPERQASDRTRGLSLSDLTALVRAAAADPEMWQSRLRLPTAADRWWTRLAADSHVDLWLLSWLPGHTTELHDHGSSAAAFTVVEGVLSERRLEGRGRPTHYDRRPGSVIWLAPAVIHDVSGAGNAPAVSIHAYSPPLREMNYYAPDQHGTPRVVRTVRTDQPEQEPAR
jgi:predicted metal-dependent enzyme (double-stranded beta helix superfamily)